MGWKFSTTNRNLQLEIRDCSVGLGMFGVCQDTHGVDPWHVLAPTKLLDHYRVKNILCSIFFFMF